MNTAIFIKFLDNTDLGIKGIYRINGRNRALDGNIAPLMNGMSVMIEEQNGVITDYEPIITDRNRKLFEKSEESFDEWLNDVTLHKQNGYCLRFRDLHKDLYDVYPFEKADRKAFGLGLKADDDQRLKALIREGRERLRGVRKWRYPLSEFIDSVRAIEGTGAYEKLALERLIKAIDSTIEIKDGILYDREIRSADTYNHSFFKRNRLGNYELIPLSHIEDMIKTLDISEEQKNAVRSLARSNPTIITGRAGTGKTTVIKAIVRAYENEYGREGITLLAPTGRAAQRMTEATGYRAGTIDSSLRKTPDSDFIYFNERNKLSCGLCIVDESSMVDACLLCSLLKALPEGSKLYLVGDCCQLYPVGCGEPFHEAIAGKECEVCELTQNFRQKGNGILKNANHILENEPMESVSEITVRHIKEADIEKYVREDLLNISPYNSVNDRINDYIVGAVNGFCEGERVIGLKNNRKAGYYNGSIGTVVRTDRNAVYVDFDGRTVKVTELKDIKPAYGITVHKMQGSEADEIQLFLPDKPDRFVTKRLLYTALTRAKKHIYLYYYTADSPLRSGNVAG